MANAIRYKMVNMPMAPEKEHFDFEHAASNFESSKAKRRTIIHRLMKKMKTGVIKGKIADDAGMQAADTILYEEMLKWYYLFNQTFELIGICRMPRDEMISGFYKRILSDKGMWA